MGGPRIQGYWGGLEEWEVEGGGVPAVMGGEAGRKMMDFELLI
jgi:hypothetical protein